LKQHQKQIRRCRLFPKKQPEPAFSEKQVRLRFLVVQRLPTFFGQPVQAKLTVSTPDDPQEKEADAVADKVMRMPEPIAVNCIPGGRQRRKN
jgi:hypothetical protein